MDSCIVGFGRGDLGLTEVIELSCPVIKPELRVFNGARDA